MIAVTGANGLLGSFIIDKLIKENIPVIAIARKANSSSHTLLEWREADVIDPVSLSEALKGVTCVIHAAAMVSFNPRASKKIFETNVTGTKNIVDACLLMNIPKLIHVSSVGALGKPKGATLIAEESKWIEGNLNTSYAESKYLAELEVFRAYEEGMSVSIINPSVILCPGDWERSSAKLFKFVWDEKLFYTEGQLNYVDVRDVVEMIFQLYQSGSEKINGQKFIANAGSIRFEDFFQQVAKRFGKRAPFIKVNPALINVASFIESIRCRLTGAEPLIVSKTIKANRHHFVYDNKKAIATLKMQFHTLEETLDWCCEKYLADNTINK
jgi:dihydroflavonol-4-reductase